MSNEFNSSEFMLSLKDGLIINEDNMVSSKDLYKYLGLSESNYSHWCKRNITNNEALKEGVDYKAVVYTTRSDNELENTGLQPNYGQEYFLQADIACDLAMEAHTKQGRAVRDYFKLSLEISEQKYNALAKQVQACIQMIESHSEMIKAIKNDQLEDRNRSILTAARLDCYDSGNMFAVENCQAWVNEVSEDVRKLAKAWPGVNGDFKKCMDLILEQMKYDHKLSEPFQNYAAVYKTNHKVLSVQKLAVISEFDDLREGFEDTLDKLMIFYNLKERPDLSCLPQLDVVDGKDYSEGEIHRPWNPTNEELEEMYNAIERDK